MANHDTNAFPVLSNITDDSIFVHQAMADLGFACEFYDLPITDQQLTLALALHLKRVHGRCEVHES